jgi:DNA polymerase-3 subunit delta
MADLKPAYLIHGDDEAKLDAWRARIRKRAGDEDASIELMDGERDSGEAVAIAMSSLTFSMGLRYIVVDGIERWKDKDVGNVVDALASPPPDTVVVLIGPRQPTKKWTPSTKLVKAVQKAGGDVTECARPKGGQLPRWVVDQGAALGLSVDRDAAQALIERNGTRQRRLQRELEKIAQYAPEGGKLDVQVVEELTAADVEAEAYELADALIEGDRALALARAEDLRDRDEDIMRLLYAMLRRAHDMRRAWAILEAGGTSQDVAAGVKMPPWLAKRLASQARSADPDRLERIAADLADLDFAIRGGGDRDTDTALTLTLAA